VQTECLDSSHCLQGYVRSHLIFLFRHASQDNAGRLRFRVGAAAALVSAVLFSVICDKSIVISCQEAHFQSVVGTENRENRNGKLRKPWASLTERRCHVNRTSLFGIPARAISPLLTYKSRHASRSSNCYRASCK
jgi:hypothetical protein